MKLKSIFVIFITLLVLPILVPYFNFSSNINFMSIPYNVVDTNTYFSFMQQAKEGNLLFTNKFTSENVPYIIFSPVYLVVGWLSILLSPIVAYYLFKFIFLILFVYLVYKILKLAVKETELNVSAFFVLFGSGIGYIFILLSNLGLKRYGSADYWISETNSVALNIAPVHFVISICLMILIVIFYFKFWENRKLKYLFLASLFSLTLGFIHLFDLITLIAAFSIYMLWRIAKGKDRFIHILKYNLLYGIPLAIPFVYTYSLYALNPFFKAWNEQNFLPTPELKQVIFGFFFPLMFAMIYFAHKFYKKQKFNAFEALLFGWVFSGFALLYSPFNIQLRFIEGLYIPIMILGSLGFLRVILPSITSQFKIKNIKAISIFMVFVLISPTSFYWLYKINAEVTPNVKIDDYTIPYFLDKSELEAMQWLEANTNRKDVVLSSYGVGNYIPRISGNKVFLGHWAQTIDFQDKKALAAKFFSTNGDDFRKDLIKSYGIGYVYYGIEERKLGSLNPDYMQKVFENEKVMIFKYG